METQPHTRKVGRKPKLAHLKPFYTEGVVEAGCDEAGRGCLAGPVVAAAVVLPPGYDNPQLNDSKQLSLTMRRQLREKLMKEALSYAVVSVSNTEIDRMNILWASLHAMNMAVQQLTTTPELLLIDGNRFRNETAIPYVCVVKGDATYQSIAAASILAKTYRDDLMQQLHVQYPHYGWNTNMGYPTPQHYMAIERYGITPEHRRSFCLERQLSLPLDDNTEASVINLKRRKHV